MEHKLWTPTPPTKMRALAAVQSLDTAHHMHSLLLSHGNEWNTSFGRDQGAVVTTWVAPACSALIFPTLLATPTPPTKMRALAAVQSLDTAHHMHSLLLSHGNEWNTSFGRDQGAPVVKHGLLQQAAP